jgi:hypothetical protein
VLKLKITPDSNYPKFKVPTKVQDAIIIAGHSRTYIEKIIEDCGSYYVSNKGWRFTITEDN